MENSLLRLIQNEDWLMTEIRRLEEHMRDLRIELLRIKEYPYDCPARRNDINLYAEYIDDTANRLAEKKAELELARTELGDYIARLVHGRI